MKKYAIKTAVAWEIVVGFSAALIEVARTEPMMIWAGVATFAGIVIMLYTLGFWAAAGVFVFVFGANMEQAVRITKILRRLLL